MKTKRDNNGKLRIAEGSKHGGQYTVDVEAGKKNLETLKQLTQSEETLHVANVKTLTIMSEQQRTQILKDYTVAALWTNMEDNPEKTIHDVNPDENQKLLNEFNTFVNQNLTLVNTALNETENYTAEQFGHDLWMTRTGQGVGFWDREQLKTDDLGEKLTEAVQKNFKPVDLIEGDDGQLYYE